MKSIRAVSEKAGRTVSIEEIKSSYNRFGHRIDEINTQLKNIEDDGIRLAGAKKILDTFDMYRGRTSESDRWRYDSAKAKLSGYGIKDKSDLLHQESIHASKMKVEQPKLQKEIVVIQPGFNMLYRALQAWDAASREEKYKRNRGLSKSQNFNKYKDRDDMDYDR